MILTTNTRQQVALEQPTTLNILFSVTYWLELGNAIIIYCMSSPSFPTKVKLVVWIS